MRDYVTAQVRMSEYDGFFAWLSTGATVERPGIDAMALALHQLGVTADHAHCGTDGDDALMDGQAIALKVAMRGLKGG